MSNYNLYKFSWDCGRMGEVESLFIATPDELEKVIGKEVYFGEILGKHSEVYGEVNKDDIKKIDIPNETVLILKNALGETISGYNPLDYYEDR